MKSLILSLLMLSSTAVLADAPNCVVKKAGYNAATVECSCPAAEKIKSTDDGLVCLKSELSYAPTQCSYNPQTKVVSNCLCNRALDADEKEAKFVRNNRTEANFNYVYVEETGLCERTEWVSLGKKIECGPNAKEIAAKVSKQFKVLAHHEEDLQRGGAHLIGACGYPTDYMIYMNVFSKDATEVSKLAK